MNEVDVYFFGKLKKHRDFIESSNLHSEDKYFWQTWFHRCNQTGLPFAGKVRIYPPIWLFIIQLDYAILYGLAAPSEDMQGREYPFVFFQKTSIKNGESIDMAQLYQFYPAFSKSVEAGYLSEQQLLSRYNGNEMVGGDICFSFLNSDLLKIQAYSSIWFECHSHQRLESSSFNCSLFHKLFDN